MNFFMRSISICLLLGSALANAQIPSTLLISKTATGSPIVGNLAMTNTTRPAGTTLQTASFMLKGHDFFYNGKEGGVQRQWHPHFYQLWVILRGSGVAEGRGVLLGNLNELAVSSPSSGACPQTGMAQSVLFGTVMRLFASSCMPQQLRLVDDRWYRINLNVADAKVVKYSITEVTSGGVVIKTLVSNMTTTVVPLPGQPDPPIGGTGFGLGAMNHPNGAGFMLEIKNLSVAWW